MFINVVSVLPAAVGVGVNRYEQSVIHRLTND